MLKENEANNLLKDEELINKILLIIEEFNDDILPQITKGNDFIVTPEINNNDNSELILSWKWKSRHLNNKKSFRRQAQTQTESDYLNSLKAYFFDIVIMLINL